MSVTLNDIAKVVGVSQNTVSRALRGKPDISKDTTDRIRKLAEALGYRPNIASRALRYNKFNNIGVLMGGADAYYLPQQMLGAFSQRLAERGYTCSLVCTTSVDLEHLKNAPLLEARLVDSIVIGYVQELPNIVVEQISRIGVPVVWLNRWLDHDSVVVGEGDAVHQLMSHLNDCDYKSVMYVDYTTGGEDWVNHKRLQAFDSAAEEFGLRALRMAHRKVPRGKRYEVTRSWLSKPDRPRAVMVSELTAAQAILQTALHMGLKVPEDLAICSFDNGRRYSASVPTITCAIRPEKEFGIAAAEMSLAKALKPNDRVSCREVSYTLAIGGSTVLNESCVYLAGEIE